MEICILNPYFYPYKGGTEKVLLEVYGRLAKRHNITVLTSTVPGRNVHHTDEIKGIKVVRLKTHQYSLPGLPLPFESFEGLNEAIMKTGAELHHINNRYQYFYFNMQAVKQTGKLCLTIHNSLPTNINAPTDFFGYLYDVAWGRRIMHGADLITGVSKSAIESTVPESERRKAHVVYNGVDYKNFRRHPKSSPKVAKIIEELGFKGTTIICNGRFVPQKGQIYLMQAMSMISEHGDMPNLLLVGKGPMEGRLRAEAAALGINMQMRSDIGDERLPYYYSACDIAVAPSLYEPASLAVLEGMSCGLPVVASRVGGLPEMVGRCGIYSKPKDPESIASGISEILSDPKKVHRMGQQARRRMIERHSWDKIAKQYEELFLNTLRY
ncbi:MAG: glycosyltransferase family 4 protein [Candidatus Micrarchaeota archaeon]|nr:glycosyltransferase family 4 protein [Candidatus Micrarchaeota archaeon]